MVAGSDSALSTPEPVRSFGTFHRRPAPHGRLVRALRRANHSRLRGKMRHARLFALYTIHCQGLGARHDTVVVHIRPRSQARTIRS